MKRTKGIALGLLALVMSLTGCMVTPPASEVGWVTLFDGTNLNNFNRLGDANWRIDNGIVVADLGGKEASYLVTKESYGDFQIRAEFWVDSDANSGIFIRITTPPKITATESYEVNIYDARAAGLDYGTGGIPNFAKVEPPYPKTAGQWNTYVITAKGPLITVELNGRQTSVVRDAKMLSGPFALQGGAHGKAPGGAIKWRKVQVREL